jgi:hypothetical protein
LILRSDHVPNILPVGVHFFAALELQELFNPFLLEVGAVLMLGEAIYLGG